MTAAFSLIICRADRYLYLIILDATENRSLRKCSTPIYRLAILQARYSTSLPYHCFGLDDHSRHGRVRTSTSNAWHLKPPINNCSIHQPQDAVLKKIIFCLTSFAFTITMPGGLPSTHCYFMSLLLSALPFRHMRPYTP